jgi:hypothetical protein
MRRLILQPNRNELRPLRFVLVEIGAVRGS